MYNLLSFGNLQKVVILHPISMKQNLNIGFDSSTTKVGFLKTLLGPIAQLVRAHDS